MADKGLISNDAVFIDGTKIQADANKYSFTWRRTVEKYHEKLKGDVSDLYDELVEQKVIEAMKPELVETSEGMT